MNIKSEKYIQYENMLLSKGFNKAKEKDGHFYRQTTSKAAFIVNLEDSEYCVDVLYGFASTACMLGDEDYFANYGSDKDSCHIRKISSVYEENEETVLQEITQFYDKYKSLSKDDILLQKKEIQKTFLNNFSKALKPLGFKKKGAKWLKELVNSFFLTFDAQKSSFSDQYYFNVSIAPQNNIGFGCLYTRVVMYEEGIYNYQLMSDKQIESLVNFALDNYITPIISTPLLNLGKTDFVCKQCACQRNKCANCWVQKNLWGQ